MTVGEILKNGFMHPRQVANYLITKASMKKVLIILWIVCFANAFSTAGGTDGYGQSTTTSVLLLIGLAVVGAPIAGYLGLWISAFFMWLFGILFGGDAKISELFRALSFTSIPTILALPFAIAWLVVEPSSYFSDIETLGHTTISFITTVIIFISSVWSLVLTVGAVAEAHHFSIGKAIITVFLPVILLIILLVVVILLFFV